MADAVLTDSAVVAQRQAALLSATTVVTSLANYAFSLLVIHLLTPADYVAYASVQGLLLVLGSGGMAAVPWAVARHVALDPSRRAAGEALGFGLLASLVQGLAFAGVTILVVGPVSGLTLGLTAGAAAFALSVVAAPLGVLQGQQRLVEMSVLRLVETAVRLGLSLVLLLAFAADPVSPVTGFAIGSAVLFALGMVLTRGALPLRRTVDGTFGRLLRRSLHLGGVQLALASLGVMDTVVITVVGLSAGPASAYQIAALLGRVPLYLSAAIALTYYQGLSRAADDTEVRDQLGRAVRLLVVLAVPIAVLVATLPPLVLDVVSAGRGAEVAALLPATSTIGLAVAGVTVLATAHQAREEYATISFLLVPAVLAQPALLVLAGRTGGVTAFALTGVGVAVLTLLAAVLAQRRRQPWAGVHRTDALGLALVLLLALLSGVTPWAWVAAGLVALLTCAPALGLGRRAPRGGRPSAT